MDDEGRCPGRERAANDNRDADGAEPKSLRKVDTVALKLASIIGRRMAREDFEMTMHAANDNAPRKNPIGASDRRSGDGDDQ